MKKVFRKFIWRLKRFLVAALFVLVLVLGGAALFLPFLAAGFVLCIMALGFGYKSYFSWIRRKFSNI